MKATTQGREVAFMADDSTDDVRREHRRAIERKYREAHPDRVKESQRKYRERNKDKVRESRRRYREEHKEQIREYNKRAHAANPEKYREWTRRWRERNPEKALEYNRRRAPLREPMATNHGKDWREAFTALWDTQGGRCYLCGEELPEYMRRDKGGDVVFDHDHRCCPRRRSCSVCRRGLACDRCNRLVGFAADSPELLRRVADALEAARAVVAERLQGHPRQEELF